MVNKLSQGEDHDKIIKLESKVERNTRDIKWIIAAIFAGLLALAKVTFETIVGK